MSDKPYTAAKLAERWSVSESTIYEMLKDGRLQGFRLGGRLWRISADEVARQESTPVAVPPGPKPLSKSDARWIAHTLRGRHKPDEPAK